MKILMFVSVYFPSTIYGGPATVAKMQAEELVRRGHDVTIITTGVLSQSPFKQMESTFKEDNGVNIRYFKVDNKTTKFSYIYSRDMIYWLKNNIYLFDICHIHYGREINPILIASIAKKQTVPYVLQTHGMLNSNNFIKKIIDRTLIHKQLRNAHSCLVLQEIENKRILSIEDKAFTTIFPNGVFTNSKLKWDIKKLEKKNILFLARLHPRKKVLNFIKMAHLLNNIDKGFQYRVVGPDGGDLKIAKALVNKLNIQNIEFVGEIKNNDTENEYLNSSIYVLPSVNEPFPMSVIESLKLGVPTIVTDSIHNKAILESYRSVYISDGTPQSLCNAVMEIIDNRKLALELSNNGVQAVEEYLNIEKLIDELLCIYTNKKAEVI